MRMWGILQSLVVCATALVSTEARGPGRYLLQTPEFTVADIRLVDLDDFPDGATGAVSVPDTTIGGSLDVPVEANTDSNVFGTYTLSSTAALAISSALSALPEIDPGDATVLPQVDFPGPIVIGSAGDTTPSSPASLPTVLDLSRSGNVFTLGDIQESPGGYGDPADPAGDPTPDSTQLFFSQFIVHAPGEVYDTFEDDGIPYIAANINFGVGSRVCFFNSILLLRSCNGFAEPAPTILCCSESACRGYTQIEYSDLLGFDIAPDESLPTLACAETDPDFAPPPPSGLPNGPDIPPDQPALAIASVSAVDFSTWPGSDTAPIIEVDETRLDGRIPIRSFQTDILPGAFSLSSAEAAMLADIVQSELPEIAAEDAPVMDIVDFPGIEARGQVMISGGPMERRIPTVYSPFNAGFKAALIEDDDDETAIFNLSNMTVLVANSSYDGLGTSGLLNFFGLEDGQPNDLLCVQNSIFVLESCENFRQAEFGLWCCNQIQCNREFTSEFLLQIGAIQTPLLPLTCVEIGARR